MSLRIVLRDLKPGSRIQDADVLAGIGMKMRSIGWRAAKATTMSHELRLSQVTGYPCLREWQDVRGEKARQSDPRPLQQGLHDVAALLQAWHFNRLD
jgi:hypothetical protein